METLTRVCVPQISANQRQLAVPTVWPEGALWFVLSAALPVNGPQTRR